MAGGTGKVAVFNSIAFGNAGPDLELRDAAFGGFNLVSVDPLFVDPAGDDHRLRGESPARNGGTLAPPGGLGPRDLSRGPRVEGRGVDTGADEID